MLYQVLEGRLSANAIAAQRNMSHHTVRRAMTIIEQKSIDRRLIESWDDQKMMTEFGSTRSAHLTFDEPDWDAEVAYLRQGFSRIEAHNRYVENTEPGRVMKYRTYCKRIKEHLATLDPVMSLDHPPAYAMQTDFAGYEPKAWDGEPTNIVKFQLFVATLPFSRLIHASITRSQKVREHILANVAAVEYFGGTTIVITPDNLKSAIISRPRFGPARVQLDYQAFADHYGMGVVPARVRKAQDKSAVENSVKLIQRSLRLRFINRPLPSLPELKQALGEIVENWNSRILRRANGHSRRSLFEAEEESHLRPLPEDRFQPAEIRGEALVGRDYHVSWKGAYYSVPHQYIGKKVSLRASDKTVEISLNGREVAVHPRQYQTGKRHTDPQHRPIAHAARAEQDLEKWAQTYDVAVRQLAAVEMSKDVTSQQRSRRTAWIKDLPRIHSRRRFELACIRAVSSNDLRFEHVQNVLERGIEASPSGSRASGKFSPDKNVRGNDYYGKQGDAA
ncbi:IS21 family transposase [uncultured Erythrobacter sp.]|uniref:IS21 family transposase n=1 Tax=uncultured Erythrobacter sp. TaxID=263913 RepID=UPI002620D0F4|nr:IS21 family transposase [uncultured Erythrobacter sp.]